jgi:ComF family protein
MFWPVRGCAVCSEPRDLLADSGAEHEGEPFHLEALLCPKCRREVAGYSCCHGCGHFVSRGHELLHSCHADCAPLSLMLAAVPYDGIARERILALKYKGRRGMSLPLGKLVAAVWLDIGLEADLIVPVPLYRDRRRKRGYNQCDLIGKILSEETGLPIVWSALLRGRDTTVQHTLSLADREQNVAGAFAAGADIGQVAGKRILLLDDIITSGATMRNCAQVLLDNGAVEVYGLAVASKLLD